MSAAVSGELFATGSWVPSPSGYYSDGRYIFGNAVC
jgi:hypothetical protein